MTKYHAKPTTVDGIRFDSGAEARRYGQLKLLERAGKITDLELQPRFVCFINGKIVCVYIADFAYFEGNHRKVEDVKGMRTEVYKLKKKLVEAIYPHVQIDEVKA